MNYMFDGDVAKDVGTNAAVLFHSIVWWIAKNEANEKNFHDGKYWTYNSVSAFSKLFPFFTDKMVRSSLEKLEKNGYIISGNYNKIPYDRTKWYALGDIGMTYYSAKTQKSICPKKKSHLTKWANQNSNQGKPIPDSIPVSKTDSITDISVMSGKPDSADNFTQTARDVIAYLNEKAGTSYRATSKKTIEHIKARMKEGFTLSDFKRVVDLKCREWLRDEKMAKYVRPDTLFGTKMDWYLNQKPQQKRTPNLNEGRWIL